MNTANQNKGKNNDESESKQTNLGAGKRVLPRRIGSSFVSVELRRWRQLSGLITEHSQAVIVESRINFDIQLKTSL